LTPVFGAIDNDRQTGQNRGDGAVTSTGGIAMLVAKEYREKLALYQLVTKKTQEQAANQAIGEMLERVERDPEMKTRMDRAQALQQELASL
jgi:hypothetical protein